jgi:hypothetical protein
MQELPRPGGHGGVVGAEFFGQLDAVAGFPFFGVAAGDFFAFAPGAEFLDVLRCGAGYLARPFDWLTTGAGGA